MTAPERSALPPGQIETKRFPVVGERDPSGMSPDTWRLEFAGAVTPSFSMGLDELLDVATHRLVADIHCVTSWSRLGVEWIGIPMSRLVSSASVKPEARFVRMIAYSSRDHDTSIPLELAMDEAWVVHALDGEPLTVEHGGPVRAFVPGRYFYKSLKWIRRIEFLEEDRLGYWERTSSYHNVGDPASGDQRFTTGSLRPEQLHRFLEAADYQKYRQRPLIGLDLRHWRPLTADLRQLQLKNCDLSGVALAGHDLRGCNLSLSDLSGANLAGADLGGSDLEGADLRGADLTRARLTDCALSATRFDGATVTGAEFTGAWGLLETEERYLRHLGVELDPQS